MILVSDIARTSDLQAGSIDRCGTASLTKRRSGVRKRNVIVIALAAGLSALASAVSAEIVSWDFTVHSGFTAYAPGGVIGENDNEFLTNLPAGGIPSLNSGNIGPFNDAPTLLRWGVQFQGGGQSSLSTGSPTGTAMGTVFTNGPMVDTLALTHVNRPVFAPWLETATLTSVLLLKPAGAPASFQLPAAQFDIDFLETLNAEPCVAPGGPLCSDIFVADVSGAGFNSGSNSFEQPFTGPDGASYIASLAVVGLTTLTDEQCAAAGVGPNCQGFITQESNINEFQARLGIALVPLPPAGILFATALLGIGALARRSRKAMAPGTLPTHSVHEPVTEGK